MRKRKYSVTVYLVILTISAVSVFGGRDSERISTLEEVVVTAEKRSESLQDLSQAVSVVDSSELAERNLDSFVGLNTLAPGVNITKNEGFRTVISIRGIGHEANQNIVANPSISYHLDGIYIASPFSLQTDFLDLERIEVIRGPQGTLFWQNSAGGAINVTTAAPTFDQLFGSVATTIGNYDLLKLQATMNVPMSRTFAIRASASSNRHEGFSENVTLSQKLDDADRLSVRFKSLWEVTSTLDVHFMAQYFNEEINGSAQKSIVDTTRDPRKLAQDSLSKYALKSRFYSVVLDWDFSSFLLKSLTSYQNDSIFVERDNDRSDLETLGPLAPVPSIVAPEDDDLKTITHEVQLVSDESSYEKVDWVAGIFYLDTSVDLVFREYIDLASDGTFDPVSEDQIKNFEMGDYGFISDGTIERNSASFYFQLEYELLTDTRFITGFRHTDDQVDSVVMNFHARAGTDFLANSNMKMTGRLAVEYDLSDVSMLYGSYTHGFKPGGSNLTYGREAVIAPILVLPTYDAEIVGAFELGLKADLVRGRMRVNGAVFTYIYKNLQYQATDPEVFEGGVANVPESEIKGIEIETLAFLGNRVDLDVKMAWLDTEISKDHFALDNVVSNAITNMLLREGFPLFGPEIQRARASTVQNLKGNHLAKVPRFTMNVSLGYGHEIADWGEFRGSVQYAFRGEFHHRSFNNPSTDFVESYDTLNFTTRLIPHGSSSFISVMLFNATDKDGINARFTDAFGLGSTSDELIAPRQFMISCGTEF